MRRERWAESSLVAKTGGDKRRPRTEFEEIAESAEGRGTSGAIIPDFGIVSARMIHIEDNLILAAEPTMLSSLLESFTQLPLMARFALAMAVILIVPALCQKIHLPAVVGLLLAGVLFGPHGLHVGPKNPEVAY